MIQHISIEEIRQLEENARNLRSEAIFETCASLFKAIGSGIIGLAANVTRRTAGSRALDLEPGPGNLADPSLN